MAAKKQAANLPVAYDAELARMAEAYKSSEAASATGQFISFKGGVMMYRGAPVKGNELDVIVLASIFENCYYDKPFDPNAPVSPKCYAFGKTLEGMQPHPNVKEKEGDANGLCAACWANGWGSDPQGGRGKACRNTRRIAVISASPLEVEAIKKGEQAYLKLPVTSVPAYSTHVMQIADVLKKPPFGVVTTIGVVPDAKNQFRVTFAVKSDVKDKELLMTLMQRARDAEASIGFPYPDIEESEAPPARGRGRQAPPTQRAPQQARGGRKF